MKWKWVTDAWFQFGQNKFSESNENDNFPFSTFVYRFKFVFKKQIPRFWKTTYQKNFLEKMKT